MSSIRPFCLTSWLAVPVAAALLLLTPVSQSRAQAQAAQATPAPAQAANPAPASPSQTTVAATSPEQRGITARAIDKVKQVAKSAGDVFNRVPCLPPKGGAKAMGSLPHVAGKLVAGKPVVIVAFGSSSTAGYGASSPDFNYPNRLAAQLRRQYPTADITVINAGVGGEDAPEMMKRLQTQVIDVHPDLVIWQVGTNDAVKGGDIEAFRGMVREGIRLVKQANTPLAILDPQFFPTVRDSDNYKRFVAAVGDVARREAVPVFSRYQTMREWHDSDAEAFKAALWSDGFHMSDAGYDCLARDMANALVGMTAPSRPVVASAR